MCDCAKLIQDELEKNGSNTMLDIPILFNFEKGTSRTDKVKIVTTKRDSRKREKAKSFFATFCPFCGEKYPE